MDCQKPNFMYPLIMDVYYPIVSQSAYGDINKRWVLNKTIICAFAKESRKTKQQVPTGVELIQDNMLIGRTPKDIRFMDSGLSDSITNVLITNIRDINGNSIYNETAGPRKDKTTLFEIKTNEPVVGPFGSIEYWNLVIKRSENQGADV